MPRVAPIVLVAAAVLFVPSTGRAKETSKVAICGPSACTSITDRTAIRRWIEGSNGGPRGPAPLAPFYRLDVTVSTAAGETFRGGTSNVTWSVYYVPSVHALRAFNAGAVAWGRVDSLGAAFVARNSKGIRPFPKPVIDWATVGGRRATDPASYARLFSRAWHGPYGWPSEPTKIRLHSAPASPWTDGKNLLLFSAKQQLLVRDGETVRVPSDVARQLQRARSLNATPGGGSGLAIGFAGAAALALGAIGWWDYRRRHS
jgi:hypothetical protein